MNLSVITQDPMLLLEVAALAITTLHLTRTLFSSSVSATAIETGTYVLASREQKRSIPSRIKSIFDVGSHLSLPKRSLRYQHPSYRL
jgi:hypothetical protein